LLVEVSTTNILADCTADDVAWQVSRGSTLFSSSAVEPWIVVNPVNRDNIVGIWQQDRWNDGGARGVVVGVSFDGGQTWQAVDLPGVTLCGGGDFQRASDPWLSFAPDGTLHAVALAIDQDPDTGGFGFNGVLASRSTDGGLTWSAPVALTETNDPFVLNDKESITADPNDPNYVYAVWDRLQPYKNPAADYTGPTMFARSTDGGLTWKPPRAINKPGKFRQTLGNQIVVQPNGTLLNVAVFVNVRKSSKSRYAIAVQRSFNHGVTWQKIKSVVKTQPHSAFNFSGVYDPESGQPLRTGDIIPAVAVDPVTGTIYAAWQDSRFNGNAFDEIALAQSVDGRKWTKPVKINLTPTTIASGNRQAFTPSIRVATNGTLCVTYYDFRNNDNDTPLLTDVWAAFCTPAAGIATNWSNEVRLTDESFDFLQAPNAEGFFVGDYEGLATDGTDFLAFWSQPQDANPAEILFRRLTPLP
jgi:hypothetical protein